MLWIDGDINILSALQSTYEAAVLQHVFLVILFCSQITECIDDHTKNKVQHNDDEHDVERQIIDDSVIEQIFL